MKNIKYFIFLIILCFFSISMVNALESSYKMNSYKDVAYKLTCTIDENSVACTANFDAKINKNSLKPSDYLDDNNYSCDKVENIYADFNLNGTSYTINDLKTVNSCNGECLTFNLQASAFPNKPSSDDPQEETEEENSTFDTESFCSKNTVKGAFRVIGWVIIFLKILVPIIIIGLGSFDVFKAVTAGKSDEVGKSVKTLVMRVIAGIIVFLVPTLMDFVIKFVSGGEEIYSEQDGTFKNCTYCMFHPTDDNCGSLMGGQ